MEPISRAPLEFSGTIEDLFNLHTSCVALPLKNVQHLHSLISQYLSAEDPLYIVRSGSVPRGTIVTTSKGIRLLGSDNSPAWWVHDFCRNDSPCEADAFDQAIREVPTHIFDATSSGVSGINRAGWYVAHILPAKFRKSETDNWSREDAAASFLRNLHPANHFYVPGGRAVGEDVRVIAYAAQCAANRYRAVWDELLALAGRESIDYLRSLPTVTGRERIEFRPGARRGLATVPVGDEGIVEYRKSRLWFVADIIESLGPDQAFRIVTPMGVFQLTRRQFEETFPNVVASTSYRIGRNYHSKTVPAKANRFLVDQ